MATNTKVVGYKDEDVSSLLKRFKKELQKNDLMYEFKRREYFVNKSLKNRLKEEHARKFIKTKKKYNKEY